VRAATEYTAAEPHGGALVNRRTPEEEREERLEQAEELPKVVLGSRGLSDLEMISTGVFSPLTGFMDREDYESVVETMHLSNGLVWSMPITLSANEDEANGVKEGNEVALANGEGRVVATMTVTDRYSYDKSYEARAVYRTDDGEHPGVAALYRQGDTLLGGEVTLLDEQPNPRPFPKYYYEPGQLRALFAERGWRRVVGFQTRNPVHRAHEYIQKSALETVDGLLLNPLVGETKSDDISAAVRMRSYEVILDRYYPKQRTVLAVFPASMRYAGPREAIFHAICRKNYGCTHFIIGRDHAGVGDYYGTYDAQHIFDEFDLDELGITPLFFEHAFFCLNCEGMVTTKTCPHGKDSHVFFSGTKVRQMLARGEYPPPEFSRPEVVEVLIKGLRDEEKIIKQPRTFEE
jgi:sulfate adenylyltransferase